MFKIGKRDFSTFIKRIFKIENYLSIIRFFSIHKKPLKRIVNEILSSGTYTKSLRFNTPTGTHQTRLYSPDDFSTFNLIFCRKDYLHKNKHKVILDIGSNIGAILMNTKCTFKYAVGVEYNKYLIKISNELKDYLDLKNCEFYFDDFMKIELDKKFDVILSLANHHTFDKNIDNKDLYFKKIYNLLKINGILIFESHSPLYEKEKDLILVLEKLKTEYETIENGIYKFGNFFDLNRKFFIFKKK